MPYIKANDGRREALRNGDTALTAGELNYQIFFTIKHFKVEDDLTIQTISEYVKNFLGEKPNYQKYNDMTGALIRCAFEIERRLKLDPEFLLNIMLSYNDEINTYEDLKIQENGDVE